MSKNGIVGSNDSLLIAAIEQAKQELREEFDQDIMALGVAVFGTTNQAGQLLKPGIVHVFAAADNAIAFLMEKLGFTPEDVNNWLKEKAKLASQPKPSIITEA